MIVTLLTYAAAPRGIFCWTDFGSKPSTVTVVLTPRKLLCTVYLGVKGERTSSSDDEGTK